MLGESEEFLYGAGRVQPSCAAPILPCPQGREAATRVRKYAVRFSHRALVLLA